MAFTLPTSMAPKVVFIQYLAALAISEALDPAVEGGRGEGLLGVRIKWPNDVYALVRGEGGKEEKVKIGGILVNSNYANGQFKIMVGESRIPSFPLCRALAFAGRRARVSRRSLIPPSFPLLHFSRLRH
jgi:hypothetical protein